jgi:hypothetical protein
MFYLHAKPFTGPKVTNPTSLGLDLEYKNFNHSVFRGNFNFFGLVPNCQIIKGYLYLIKKVL